MVVVLRRSLTDDALMLADMPTTIRCTRVALLIGVMSFSVPVTANTVDDDKPTGLHLSDNTAIHMGNNFDCKLELMHGPEPFIETTCPIIERGSSASVAQENAELKARLDELDTTLTLVTDMLTNMAPANEWSTVDMTPTADKKYLGGVAVGTTIYFVPHNENAIGKLDTTTDTFATLSPGIPGFYKYNGGVAVGTTIYFVPYNENAIGKLDTTTDTFTTLSPSGMPTGTSKYNGGVAVGTTIYFVPYNENAIGKLDTTTDTFTTLSPSGMPTGNYKYNGGVAVGTTIYFVPYVEDTIGKLDTTTNIFSTVAMTPTVDGKYSGGVAVGTTIYFAPYHANAIGKLDTTTDTFTTLSPSGMPTGSYKYSACVAVRTALFATIYFVPFYEDAIGKLSNAQ